MPEIRRPQTFQDAGPPLASLPEVPPPWRVQQVSNLNTNPVDYGWYYFLDQRGTKFWLAVDPRAGVWLGPMGAGSKGKWYPTAEEAVATWLAQLRLGIYEGR